MLFLKEKNPEKTTTKKTYENKPQTKTTPKQHILIFCILLQQIVRKYFFKTEFLNLLCTVYFC